MDYKKLRQRSLILDCLVIVVAIATLYLGANTNLPAWVAVLLLVITVVLLAGAIFYAYKARKIATAEYKKLQEAADKAILENENAKKNNKEE